ncbi:MAG: hypothetical protein JW715_13715 [Sedimentisphaerales bacterium]|nr:hypothetical protein [Sedimentisphaerales bacterium]
MTEAQIEQIKKRWHSLRYARVDFWQSLGGDETKSTVSHDISSINSHPDYVLTQRSLTQLLSRTWVIVAPAPDYFRDAVLSRGEIQKQRQKALSEARRKEIRLEREYSGQLLQSEYISFLLAALLETTEYLQDSIFIGEQKETEFEQQNRTTKGGDAYDLLNNVSTE